MNAATNVKQIQGNHTPITMLVGFVALLAIAIAVCAIASSATASLTGFTLAAAQTPLIDLDRSLMPVSDGVAGDPGEGEIAGHCSLLR